MRILLAHNFYGSSAPSGENRVVLEERDLLRAAGHEVLEHFTSSDTVRDRGLFPLLRSAALVPWNPAARASLARRIRDLAPDVLHVHNVFPLLSPSIFSAAAGTRTAVVNTLHNFRTVCPNALLSRAGSVCTLCPDRRSTLPALRRGCYRGSRLATLPLAAGIALHRRLQTYTSHVDAFIALTEFQKSLLVRAGLPAARMHVKPNCFPGQAHPVAWSEREPKAIFLGRLSPEKGVHLLLDAWARWGAEAPRLEILGDGPDRESLARAVPPALAGKIQFLGARPPAETLTRLSTARLLVIASTWFEGFPLVLREAIAYGVPVLAPRLGAFPGLVETSGLGRLFTAGSSADLHQTACALWQDPGALEQMSGAALAAAKCTYSPEANLSRLYSIYNQALEHRRTQPELTELACLANDIR